MTRQECEAKLIEATEKAFEILREFDPNARSMSLDFRNGFVSIDGMNKPTNDETDFGDLENTYNVYATKYPSGEVWHTDRWMACRRESA